MIEKEKIYQEAINHYGKKAQRIVVLEELSELQKAICKYERNAISANIERIAEEVADVEIMVEQLKLMFDLHEKVDKVKIEKITRLSKNIQNEQNNLSY